jgi:hypothetical protein
MCVCVCARVCVCVSRFLFFVVVGDGDCDEGDELRENRHPVCNTAKHNKSAACMVPRKASMASN